VAIALHCQVHAWGKEAVSCDVPLLPCSWSSSGIEMLLAGQVQPTWKGEAEGAADMIKSNFSSSSRCHKDCALQTEAKAVDA